MSDFVSLGVPQPFAAALRTRGITTPTPIQAATLPDSLEGRDVLGRGRTGSGKTFAFLLPTATRLLRSEARRTSKRPRALILAPTRELASQIAESFEPLGRAVGLNWVTVFGGVGQNPQVRALADGVDVLIACPGRLLDLMGQGAVDLGGVEITVLDEADHMADMGFLPMVKRILDRVPQRGQRMLLSATLDNGIDVLVKRYLHQPVVHEADSAHSPVAAMEHHVLEVDGGDKVRVVADLAAAPGKTIVFTRTKHGAKKLAKKLLAMGVPAVDLHGNLGQNARTRNMEAFHSGRVETLVATDIAARGIHVDEVALVVHSDPPAEHKAYLHRSGRTARAGQAGTVVTIATPEQRGEVRSLMRAAKITAARSSADDEALRALAPGERTFLTRAEAEKQAQPHLAEQGGQQRGGQGRARASRSGQGRSGSSRGGDARGGGQGGRGRSRGRRGRGPAGSAGTRQQSAQSSRSGTQPARSGAQPARSGGLASFSAGGGRRSR